jgi:hypothetical protein
MKTMNTYSLSYTVTDNPDLDGFRFYVEAGRLFDADHYAEAYRLRRAVFDPQDVLAIQEAGGRLSPGQWLEVTHEAQEW